MSTPLETAYFSSVLLANGLTQHNHTKAAAARELKNALAHAITHPDTLRDSGFQTLWNNRRQFSDLNLDGELGETLARHATILENTNL